MKAKTPATGGLAAVVVLAGWLGFDVAADWAAKALGVERVECDAMFDPTCSLRSLWAWGKGAWSNLAGRSPERDPHVGTHLLDLSPEDQDRRIALIGEGEIAHLVGKGIPEEDLLSRTGDAVYWQMLLLPAPSEQARREMARIVLVATRIAIAPEEGPERTVRTIRAIRLRMCAALDRAFREHTPYPEYPVRDVYGEDVGWSLANCREAETGEGVRRWIHEIRKWHQSYG